MSRADITPIHRRIWRLAFLLTGNAPGATLLVDRIRRIRKDPASLEPALLDRLIIQNARSIPRASTPELPAATPFGSAAPAAAALAAALRLPRQPLEAWVLRRLDDLDDLHIARAMDCSKSAAKVHLTTADEAMNTRLGVNFTPSVEALRRFADSLDPAPVIHAHREEFRRRRKIRLRNLGLFAAAAFMILTYLALKFLI